MGNKQSHSNKQNSVRIIGGELRSRKINFPDRPGLRPTSDRIRETLFNWLQDYVIAERCLDLFAGSGALGIEALSRGAREVVFVESDKSAGDALRAALTQLDLDISQLRVTDARQWLTHAAAGSEPFGLVFLDPPFQEDYLYEACQGLEAGNLLKPDARIYLESSEEIDEDKLPPNWLQLKHKKAGQVNYYLYRSSMAEDRNEQ